jgi:hypothetical protein
VDAALGHAVRYALAEVIDNVFHHARSPVNAIVCAQTYPQLNQLELAIVGAGRGIPASLADNPDLRGRFHTASQAIQLAVQPKVTSRPDRNASEGLFFTTEFLRANGGAGCIYSLDGLLEYREGRPQAFDDVPRWPGTIVALRFDTRRPVDVPAIFNRHAPPADDFAWLFEAGEEPAPGGPGPAEPAPPAVSLDWLFE